MRETLTETIDRIVKIINDEPDKVQSDEVMRDVLSTYSIRGSLCHNPEFHKFGSLPCCEKIDLPPQDIIVREVIHKLIPTRKKIK